MAFTGNPMPDMDNLTNPDIDPNDDYNDLSELPHASCYTCNNRRIPRFYSAYKRMVGEGMKPAEALDRLGFHRYCCRSLMMNPIKLPLGVNADIDYKKLGLTLNPENISFRTGSSAGFLITQPRQQKRPGLAQGIGPSVPVVSGDQPLPPLMSRPTPTFGSQPMVPTIGQQGFAQQLPTVGQGFAQQPMMPTVGQNNLALPLLPTGNNAMMGNNPMMGAQQPMGQQYTMGNNPMMGIQRPMDQQYTMGAQRPPNQNVGFNQPYQFDQNAGSTLQMFGGPVIAPQGTTNRGLNMVTQGLGGLTLQQRPNINDPSSAFPVLEALPSVGQQTLGSSGQYGFRS